jgi:hypothetical protein
MTIMIRKTQYRNFYATDSVAEFAEAHGLQIVPILRTEEVVKLVRNGKVVASAHHQWRPDWMTEPCAVLIDIDCGGWPPGYELLQELEAIYWSEPVLATA